MNDNFKKHREEVSAALITALENGTAPWQRDWDTSGPGGLPYNATTGDAYKGGNLMYLAVKQMMRGGSDPRWATYNQCAWMHHGSDKRLTEKEHELNKTLKADDPRRIPTWQVRKGSKGTWIEYWGSSKPKEESAADGAKELTSKVKRPGLFVKHFSVFNADDIDGIPALVKREITWDPVETAERIMQRSGAKIYHRGTQPCYSPYGDYIELPEQGRFATAGAYYAAATHELGHWTGGADRWPPKYEGAPGGSYVERRLTGGRGSEDYAREELFAEIASMYVCADIGIPHDVTSHQNYVGSWIKKMREDPNTIFEATRGASQIADYVLSFERSIKLEQTGVEAPAIERVRDMDEVAMAVGM